MSLSDPGLTWEGWGSEKLGVFLRSFLRQSQGHRSPGTLLDAGSDRKPTCISSTFPGASQCCWFKATLGPRSHSVTELGLVPAHPPCTCLRCDLKSTEPEGRLRRCCIPKKPGLLCLSEQLEDLLQDCNKRLTYCSLQCDQ